MASGHYERFHELGRGGMGVVHLARGPDGAEVALKTVREHDPIRVAALRREIRALSALAHPGIVRILDEGVSEEGPWYAMELLRGRSLASHWSRGAPVADETVDLTDDASAPTPAAHSMAWQERVAPLAAVALALAHLHGRRLVHGDLKPSNVLVTDDGRTVLVDFGLAARLGLRESAHTLSLTASGLGSPAYLAPERAAGRPADSRSDLYAFGCMLFEALTGAPPFTGDGWSLRRRHRHSPVPVLPPEVPRPLAHLARALLSKDPADRPARAEAVARALGVEVPSGGHPVLLRPALAGRDGERQDLVARVQQVARGQGSAVVLFGPAGAGKTRLALEAIAEAHAEQVRVVAGACAPLESAGSGPLSAFSQAMAVAAERMPADLLREVGPFLAPWVPGLDKRARAEGWSTPDLPADVGRAALVDAVVTATRALAAEPLVLVVDDVQWAGPLGSDVLSRLATLATERPLLLVATARGEVAPEAMGSAVALPVGPLSEADQERLVADMLGVPEVPPSLRDWIVQVGDGSPFLVAEALRLALEDGALTGDEAGWQVDAAHLADLPRETDAIVARRLHRVRADAASLLAAAAIGGDDAPLAVLEACADLGGRPLLDAMRTLEDADVLVPTPRGLAFAHRRLRDAAYAHVPSSRRATLHLTAAEALTAESPGALAEQAHHWEHGQRPERALPLFEKAADRALIEYSLEEAGRCMRRALGLPGLDRAQAQQLRARLAQDVLLPTGDLEAVHALLAQDLTAPATPTLGVDPCLACTEAAQLRGDTTSAARLLERAAALASGVDDPRRLALVATLRAEQAHRAGQASEARVAIDAALAHAERAGDARLLVRALYLAASIARAAGALREARESAARMREQGRRRENVWMEARGLEIEGLLAVDRGDVDAVEAALVPAARLFRRMRDRRHEALALGNLAGASFHRGDTERAAALIEQAVEALLAHGDRRAAAMNVQNLGAVHELREDWEGARRAYRDAAETLLDLNDGEAAFALAATARVERRLGAPHAVVGDLLDRAERATGEDDRVNTLAVLLERVGYETWRGGDAGPLLARAEVLAAELEDLPSFLVEPLAEARRIASG